MDYVISVTKCMLYHLDIALFWQVIAQMLVRFALKQLTSSVAFSLQTDYRMVI